MVELSEGAYASHPQSSGFHPQDWKKKKKSTNKNLLLSPWWCFCFSGCQGNPKIRTLLAIKRKRFTAGCVRNKDKLYNRWGLSRLLRLSVKGRGCPYQQADRATVKASFWPAEQSLLIIHYLYKKSQEAKHRQRYPKMLQSHASVALLCVWMFCLRV